MFLWFFCILSVEASEIIVFSQKDFLTKVPTENKKLAFACSVGNTKKEGLLYSLLFLKYQDGKKSSLLLADIVDMVADKYCPVYPVFSKRIESIQIFPANYSLLNFPVAFVESDQRQRVLNYANYNTQRIFSNSTSDSQITSCFIDLIEGVVIRKIIDTEVNIVYSLPDECSGKDICQISFSTDLMSICFSMRVPLTLVYTKQYYEKKLFLPLAAWYKKNSDILNNK